MSMPLHQSVAIGKYLLKQKVKGRKKFPLLIELEPLFACNLACAGCGKIQEPASMLKQRMPVEQAVGAVVDSGAPMVSIAGGEPLMHPQIDEITRQLLDKGKFVFLCTNAVLLPKHIHKFAPHKNFAWMVHIDGLEERHDASVSKQGVFQQAVDAIKLAQEKGFRVMTNTTFFDTDTPQDVIDVLDYLNDELKVDNMQISPGFAYEKAPDQEHWLGPDETRDTHRILLALSGSAGACSASGVAHTGSGLTGGCPAQPPRARGGSLRERRLRRRRQGTGTSCPDGTPLTSQRLAQPPSRHCLDLSAQVSCE